MIPLAIAAVQLLTTTPPSGEPTVSADVGPAWISRGSIAEGLERADVFLRIPEGGATPAIGYCAMRAGSAECYDRGWSCGSAENPG